LDALAQQGVRFDRAFTSAGICAPSRAAIIMGMNQISFGAQHMRTMSRPAYGYKTVPPAEMKAFPELLRAAGYYSYTDHKLDYQFSSVQFTLRQHWSLRDMGSTKYGGQLARQS